METNVYRLRLVFIMKTKFPIYFAILLFSPFPKFWEQNFMYFRHIHVET